MKAKTYEERVRAALAQNRKEGKKPCSMEDLSLAMKVSLPTVYHSIKRGKGKNRSMVRDHVKNRIFELVGVK